MLRGILGIVAGAIAWMAVFYALVILLSLSWPEYGLQGRTWITRGVFTFTPSMACFNLLFWALAEIGAGWVAMKVARRPEAVWILASLLGLYLAALHIALYWPRFPWWYNLGVVIPAVPAVLLGGKLARAPHAVTRTVATG